MNKFNFFRQGRADGAVRAGVSVNEVSVLQLYHPSNSESNPALLWYVDIQVEGRSLPDEPEQARAWLLEQSELIKRALKSAADELEIGLDVDVWPYVSKLRGTPAGVRGSLAVSGVRGLAEGELAKKLLETAENLQSMLIEMKPLVPV
jgi:hypothetical protein